MGLKSTIEKAVDRAFVALGDLVETAVFDEEIVDSFNFVTGEADSSLEPLRVEMVPTETVTRDDSTLRTKFLVRSADFDISKYSVFTIGTTEYRIEALEIYEGLYIVEATRTTNV